MSLAALSGFLCRRFPRVAVALGFCTLTGRFACIGVTRMGSYTRVTFVPDGPVDGRTDVSATLVLANPAAPELFTAGRTYVIDVTPDL